MSGVRFALIITAFGAGALQAHALPHDYRPPAMPASHVPPQSYYLPDDDVVAASGRRGVRLNPPFAQWNDAEEPPRAYQGRTVRTPDARTWYIPAPDAEPQRHAGLGRQPNDYYYPRNAYQPPRYAPEENRNNIGKLAQRWRRQTVSYDGKEKNGTIIIDTERRFLFLVLGDGMALRYGIGVGRPGFEWAGVKSISRKAEWPDWTPPDEMLERQPDLPRFMPGGPENPLGARALYLGSSLYRIHGTNEPHTIGRAVSSGCIRMVNEDVIDLYNRVRVGTRVVVI